MRYTSCALLCVPLFVSACVHRNNAIELSSPSPGMAAAANRVDVQLVDDEAEAVVRILRKRLAGGVPADTDWQRLFSTRGYQHLAERERGMRRSFSDSAFRAFVMSDTLLGRATELEPTLAQLEHVDVHDAAARALAYLPSHATIRARLYLEIKPATNSFVFTGSDSVPSIFLYVRPHETPAQLENTLAHELHHIGLNAACPDPGYPHASQAERPLLRFLGAFGEGEAMLAAAGSPTRNPHYADDDSIQRRWDRDVAHAGADIAELSRFFGDVLDGRITSRDSVVARASSYYGVQGPWYTVGWLMASTVERDLGRSALIRDLCNPVELLRDYDRAAAQEDARGATLPTWDEGLLARLESLRARAL
jgi:putative zinc-dependent peptidase DUF5700